VWVRPVRPISTFTSKPWRCCRRLLACCRRSWSALENARAETLGAAWLESWSQGLPEWPDTPGGINLPVLLWLHNLLEAWDLERLRAGPLWPVGPG